MALKKGIYRVDNGVSWDEIMFKTIEDQIEGIYQRLSDSGFRKLPGGLILQWGNYYATNIPPKGVSSCSFSFPIRFPNRCFAVIPVANVRSRGSYYKLDVKLSWNEGDPVKFDAHFVNDDASQWGGLTWVAIGY